MCGSMVDIQSPTAEIRRGKRKKISLVSCYVIFNGHFVLVVFMFYCFNTGTFVSVFRAAVSAVA